MRYCSNCGAPVEETAKFCAHCGTAQGAAEETAYTPDTDYQAVPIVDPVLETQRSNLAQTILTRAIVALALVVAGLTLVGFIIACTNKSKISCYETMYGDVDGKARVGKYLNKGAFIAGLALTIFFAIYFALIIVIALASAM